MTVYILIHDDAYENKVVCLFKNEGDAIEYINNVPEEDRYEYSIEVHKVIE